MKEWIVTSSVLILVVLAARRLCRGRLSLRLQYALWALVLLRLLLPFSLAKSDFSVMNAVERVPAVSAVSPAPINPVPQGETQIPAVQQTPVVVGEEAREPAAEDQTPAPPTTAALLRGAWYAGMAASALIMLFCNLRFYRRLRRVRRPLAVESTLPVYLAEGLETPCLFGLFRPAIYLTDEAAGDEARLRHVLAHETTHFRHGDPWWSLLRCAALALHWYNPLVWLAAVLSRRDAELACDEGAIARMGEENRLAYGRTLIDLTAEGPSARDLLCCATTMTDGRRGIRERITLIAKKPKTFAAAAAAMLLVCALAVGCTFTGAKQAGYPDGVYVTIEYDNVVAIEYSIFTESGAASNADGSAFTPGECVFLDCGALEAAEESGETVSLQLTVRVRDSDAQERAQTSNTVYCEPGTKRIDLAYAGGQLVRLEEGAKQLYDCRVNDPADLRGVKKLLRALAVEEVFGPYNVEITPDNEVCLHFEERQMDQADARIRDSEMVKKAKLFMILTSYFSELRWDVPLLEEDGAAEVWENAQSDTDLRMLGSGLDTLFGFNAYYAMLREETSAQIVFGTVTALHVPEMTVEAGGEVYTFDIRGRLELGDSFTLGDTVALTVESGKATDIQMTRLPVRQAEPRAALTPVTLLHDDYSENVVLLDYEDSEKIVFHGYFGLFVYSLREGAVTTSVNLSETVGTTSVMGDPMAQVSVSPDGRQIQLRQVYGGFSLASAFYLDTSSGVWAEAPYYPMADVYDGGKKELRSTDGTLGGLTYTAGGKSWKVLEEYAVPRRMRVHGMQGGKDIQAAMGMTDGRCLLEPRYALSCMNYTQTEAENAWLTVEWIEQPVTAALYCVRDSEAAVPYELTGGERIAVPRDAGWYKFMLEVQWADGIRETGYFSVYVV